MHSTYPSDAPRAAGLPAAAPAPTRIAIPLSRVLDFARHEPGFDPSRRVAFALRPLLALALSTAGLCQDQAAVTPPPEGSAEAFPPPVPSRSAGAPPRGGGDPELLFTALSSLVEIVKRLTPNPGRIYANLGHEALPPHERREGPAGALAPRSEVFIELVSIAGTPGQSLPAAPAGHSGALAFELAVVAAIVESKGGQLSLTAPGGPSRSFVVRLPVQRSC